MGLTGSILFHRAIVQSGTALSSWSLATNPVRYARRLAAAVNCTTNMTTAQSTGYIHCLKGLSVQTLVNAEVPGVPHRYLSAVGPTVDRRTVLPSDIRTLMLKNVDSVLGTTPLLLGVTRDEGQIFLAQSDLDQVLSLSMSSCVHNIISYWRKTVLRANYVPVLKRVRSSLNNLFISEYRGKASSNIAIY